MRRISSFKERYRQASARAATPPPPAYEPLSPLLSPTTPSTAQPAGNANRLTASLHPSGHTNHAQNTTLHVEQGARAPQEHLSPAVTYEPSSRSAPRPSQYTLPRESPIETLADVAMTTQHTGPAYIELSRQTSHPAASPATLPYPIGERAPTRVFAATDTTYSFLERPAKRARSEVYGSPQYGQSHARPATSHIPGWSYNVEQMVDSGSRMYQNTGHPNDRLSDAQLLLDFFNVSTQTAHSPPSTAKRWSVSQSAPAEQASQQTQHTKQTREPAIPYVAPLPPSDHDTLQTQAPVHVTDHSQPSADPAQTALAAQTHTPPEDTSSAVPQPEMQDSGPSEEAKPKKHQGWPKGKPRGPRSTSATGKRKRSTPKPKSASSTSTSAVPDQLQSPLSLAAEQPPTVPGEGSVLPEPLAESSQSSKSQIRRHSFSTPSLSFSNRGPFSTYERARSLPLGPQRVVSAPVAKPAKAPGEPDLICAACNSSAADIKIGDGEQWIGCDGCKEWYHYPCAGFNSEREVREVNKFYCEPCRPKFGETTKVRKSVRAHTTVDYAGLNEGVLKTSDDNPEHHYIAAFKNGDIEFTPETFARVPAQLITGDFLEKMNGFKEPILIPSALNSSSEASTEEPVVQDTTEDMGQQPDGPVSHFEYETVADDGQDSLDMVIPKGLTVRRVAELYGPNEPVPVIDVKAQEGEGKKWTMGKWADYYEQQGEKPVRNVISLEVSRSRLGKLIRRPKAVRDMDLQDSVWREDDKFAPPPVQFYCLMSVADCFTDFHIDFGGSSVYYHIVKGRKVFFFIPPTKQNLKKYEDWCLSPNQGHDWLGKQVKECYRVDLYPGDTMLIPSGWIHAVWTPEDSLVIGGNFLTRIHYGMQIKILEIEKSTKVALQFRYPFFQKIMWLTVIKYLEEDPVPEPIQQLLQSGEQFQRSIPIYCEPDRFGHNSHLGAPNYNRRYYSKHELEGLADLLNYIWRTVLITEGKIDVPQKTRGAVNKSIPKGHGEPLVLARCFAMWIAWKRGNETIPSWAFSDATLPEVAETAEKKLSAAQVKRLERETLNEALRATAERSSARIRASDVVPEPSPPDAVGSSNNFDMMPVTSGPLTGFLRPSANNPHITTPKTSQLGPKRVACDACRKRRIRCKHKDDLIDTLKPGMHTIDLSGSYGISVKRRLSDHSIADSLSNGTSGPVNGGPIMADVNGDPYALKSGRVKACADCRKSKRRCIHDEYGNVDPIKANEIPIPRGSASKRRRVSDEDTLIAPKRMRQKSSYDDEYLDGDMHSRHSLPNQYSGGPAFLRDIAYSAQQALDQTPDDDLVPVDPALQAYANIDYTATAMEMGSLHTNGDTVMSSVEYQPTDLMLMDGMELTGHDGEAQKPRVGPQTPGPPPHNDTAHAHTNGFASKPTVEHHAVRHPSSPVSPRHVSATSPIVNNNNYNPYLTSPATNNYNNFTTNSDFPPPPITPSYKALGQQHSSGRKSSQTPSRGGRNSKTPKSTPSKRQDSSGIKLEHGMSMGTGVGMNMGMLGMIDPNLDQASFDLIKQLQQEDLGLRRRSR